MRCGLACSLALAALATGCNGAYADSEVRLVNPVVAIHGSDDSAVVEGTVDLRVAPLVGESDAWLFSLALSLDDSSCREIPVGPHSSCWQTLPNAAVTPVSQFPIHAAEGSAAIGTVRFRANYPVAPGLAGWCRETPLFITGTAYDTASQPYYAELPPRMWDGVTTAHGTMPLEPISVTPERDPPPPAPLTLAWALADGDPSQLSPDAWSVAIDADGGALVTGSGPFAGSKSQEPAVAAKITKTGSIAWQLPLKVTGGRIAVAAGGPSVVLHGRRAVTPTMTLGGEDGAFLARLDSSGQPLWVHAFPSVRLDSRQEAFDVAIAPDGDIVAAFDATGAFSFQGTDLPPSSKNDVVVMRLDAQGMLRWARRFAGTIGTGKRTAIDDAGRAIVAVEAWTTVDPGGGPVTIDAPSTLFFATDPMGQVLWTKTWTTPSDSVPGSVAWVNLATDSAGSVIALGQTWSFGTVLAPGVKVKEDQLFLTKLSTAGEHVWVNAFPLERGLSWPAKLAVDAQDRPLVAGLLDEGNDLGTIEWPETGLLWGSIGMLFVSTWNTDGSLADTTALGCGVRADGYVPHLAFRRGASDHAAFHAIFERFSAIAGAQRTPSGKYGRVVASFRP